MSLPKGHYRTKAGSAVEVYGKDSGSVRVRGGLWRSFVIR